VIKHGNAGVLSKREEESLTRHSRSKASITPNELARALAEDDLLLWSSPPPPACLHDVTPRSQPSTPLASCAAARGELKG